MVASGSRTMIAGFFIQLYRWVPSVLQVVTTSGPRRSCVGIGPLSPLLAIGSRATGRTAADRHGAPRVDPQMSTENQLWGAPRYPRRTAQAWV